MKIAIVTSLFAEWYVNVDAAHFSVQYSVAVGSNSYSIYFHLLFLTEY